MANVPYTVEEYYNMFACLTRTGRDPNDPEQDEDEGPNPRRAAALYRETYQNHPDVHRFPDYRVFQNLLRRLMNGGPLVPEQHLTRPRQGRPADGIPEELHFLVMLQFLADPHLSTRVCAVRLGLRRDESCLISKCLQQIVKHQFYIPLRPVT